MESRELSEKESLLIIKGVEASDVGTYECMVYANYSNLLPVASKELFIFILSLSLIILIRKLRRAAPIASFGFVSPFVLRFELFGFRNIYSVSTQ